MTILKRIVGTVLLALAILYVLSAISVMNRPGQPSIFNSPEASGRLIGVCRCCAVLSACGYGKVPNAPTSRDSKVES